ncbi:MAG TPA: hypothetical protein VMF10_14885 [Candidatus Aquilonibacter sp.]|nr:hypothetical protein [Candidatus Aquilonibacter sp.]
MSCKLWKRFCLSFWILVFVLSFAGCEKKKAPEQVADIDRVGDRPAESSENIVHKTFTVRTSEAFPFEVPAHVAVPHLHGNYKSFVTKVGIESNEHSADVDFFVFDEQQYADFAAGTAGNSVFASDPSNDQAVDLSLPPSLSESKKYYLVFRNTPGGDAKKTVQADLTVDF